MRFSETIDFAERLQSSASLAAAMPGVSGTLHALRPTSRAHAVTVPAPVIVTGPFGSAPARCFAIPQVRPNPTRYVKNLTIER